ncbi:hypothetical protein pb186bvf_019035, partial [Paramecium bursaria]
MFFNGLSQARSSNYKFKLFLSNQWTIIQRNFIFFVIRKDMIIKQLNSYAFIQNVVKQDYAVPPVYNNIFMIHAHQYIQLSMMFLEIFQFKINEEMINQMLDQQIITFNLKNEKIGSKICIYQGICQLEASKFAISNNQQLIVVLDRQKLCMFQALNNQKIMRVIKVDEEIFSIKFSTSDQFLYLCQKDRIIQLD